MVLKAWLNRQIQIFLSSTKEANIELRKVLWGQLLSNLLSVDAETLNPPRDKTSSSSHTQLGPTHLEYLTRRPTHNQDDMMRQGSYQLVHPRPPTEADPQCAGLKSVCLSATRLRIDCLVSGQGLSWSGALTGFSGKGTGYCSHKPTDRPTGGRGGKERREGGMCRKWIWGKEDRLLGVRRRTRRGQKKAQLQKMCVCRLLASWYQVKPPAWSQAW